jgi:parallel beta-helix repeat protein
MEFTTYGKMEVNKMNNFNDGSPYDEFQEISIMKYWTITVLPSVFTEALSYQEILSKVTEKLNTLIVNNNKLPKFIQDLIEQYISSGAIGDVVRQILADFMLNVKNPPNNLKPAIGDGTIDDTEAIQGCIDYAYAHGGKFIYFPSGSYLTQSLTLKDNVSFGGFDRNTTRLVLKGGATQPLIKGNSSNNTISKMTLDGNMSIQVNDIDTVDLTGGKYTFNELRITDGYTLMKLNLNDYVQADSIIFDIGVIDSVVLNGSGKVIFNNIICNSLSTLSGRYAINNSVNNALFTEIYINCVTNYAINNTSNNSVFVAKITNSVNSINDIGTNTYTNFYQKGGSVHDEIVAERTARELADIALQNSINAEKSARETADSNLQESLNTEKNDRIAQDLVLQNNINAEKSARETADSNLQESLNTEKNDRIAQDLVLQNNINAEKSARETADSNLQIDINSLKNSVPINVKSFGAVGNGIADDTIALRTALSSLSNGGILYFPIGTYLISGFLTIPSNVTLKGVNNNVTKIRFKDNSDATGAPIFGGGSRMITNSSADGSNTNRNINITLEDLAIDGNGENQTNGLGVAFNKVDNLNVVNCKFTNCGKKSGSTILIYQQGLVMFECHTVTINKNIFANNSGDGLAVADSCNTVYVIENLSTNNGDYGIVLTNMVFNGVVSGNICKGNSQHGIGCDECFDISITGNICDGNTASGIILQRFDYNPLFSNKIYSVNGNICVNNNMGVQLHITENAVVSGNTINNNVFGLQINDSKKCYVTGNIISNSGEQGVLFISYDSTAGTSDNYLSNNYIADNKIGVQELNAGGVLGYNSIFGNLCERNTSNYSVLSKFITVNPNSGNDSILFSTGRFEYDPSLIATSATAGTSPALPETPAGYIKQVVNGNEIRVPYYNF